MRPRWRTPAALLVAWALVGCIADVDLGHSPDQGSTPDAATPDAAPPDVTPPDLLDSDRPSPDVGAPDPEPTLDATPAPDHALDAGLPDAEPDVPPDPFEQCGPCIAALAEACEAPGCVLDAAMLDRCALACDLPDGGDCVDCEARAESVLRACFEYARPPACEPLVGELFRVCEADCGPWSCSDCVYAVDGGCPREAPALCADTLAEGFSACFGLCDGAALSAGVDCAAEAGESWAVCTAAEFGPCDAGLDEQIDGCRMLATDGCAACGALAEAGQALCAALGVEPAACSQRVGPITRACIATCIGEPWDRCAAAGETSALACRWADGIDCGALQAIVEASCLGQFGPGEPCDGCLSRALWVLDGCPGDAVDCLADLEHQWGVCLETCERRAPDEGCLECGLAADRALAQCLADGLPLDGCLAERTQAAVPCAAICGDAIPRALPCSLRAATTLDRCLADQPGERCFDGAFLLGAACRWTRGGVD